MEQVNHPKNIFIMSTLTLKIQNSSGIADDEVYIGFWGSSLDATINGDAMQSIQDSSTWYKLSAIETFTINSTTSGRIYVAYNGTFSPNSGGGMPSFIASNSPAYYTRYDKFELTFDGTKYGVADLTAIDYWAIPMSLSTSKGGSPVGTPLNGVKSGSSAYAIYTHLSALSNPVQSGGTAKDIIAAFAAVDQPLAIGIQEGLTSPASGLVTNNNGDFIRVIGANSYPPFGSPNKVAKLNVPPGLPYTPYNTFQDYYQYLIDTFGPGVTAPSSLPNLGNGKIAHISGDYVGSAAGSGGAYDAQTYDLWASIDDDFNLTIAGTGSVVGEISLKITKWDLLAPSASYGGNPTFTLGTSTTTQTPINNLYAWIFGDFFAGLNIGAIGSVVSVGGTVVGGMTSSEWFENLPGTGQLFSKLWGTGVTDYWNQWAAALNPRSDAYNFAYAERFSAPQLSLNPDTVDTLNLTLLNADVTTKPAS